MPKLESVSLPTTIKIAELVIPELALAQVGIETTPTRVGTKQRSIQIMKTNTSKPWGTSSFSDKEMEHEASPKGPVYK